MNPHLFDIFDAVRPMDWQETVAQIKCPILLITGDPALGALVTQEVAQRAAALWRHGKVAHIAGAGHSIRREQFEEYMTVLNEFLADQCS